MISRACFGGWKKTSSIHACYMYVCMYAYVVGSSIVLRGPTPRACSLTLFSVHSNPCDEGFLRKFHAPIAFLRYVQAAIELQW
jgi:hypothetical protein